MAAPGSKDTPWPPSLAPALTLVQGAGQLGPDIAIRAGALRFHSQRHEQGRVRGFGAPRGRGRGGGNSRNAPHTPRNEPKAGAQGRAGRRPVASVAPRREPSPQQGAAGEGHRGRRPEGGLAGAAKAHGGGPGRTLPAPAARKDPNRAGGCPGERPTNRGDVAPGDGSQRGAKPSD